MFASNPLPPLPAESITPIAPEPVPEKPTMTRRDASWHTAVAGIRAAKAAEAAGCAPEAREALAYAAAAEAGISTLPPIGLDVLWAMEATEPYQTALCPTDVTDRALFVLTLQQPMRVLLAALDGDLDDIRRGMLDVSAQDAAIYYQLSRHWAAELSRLRALTGGADTSGLAGK